MKNRNYKVCRDNIYVGEVVRTDQVNQYKGEVNCLTVEPGQIYVSVYNPYRSMLFIPNEENLANDLLYQSPNYPILNVTDDKTCLGLGEKSIVIKDACNLAALLKYFKYEEELTYQDILSIRKKFFTGKFAKDNCELFGYKESKPEDYTYLNHGVKITNPKELKLRILQEKISQKLGHRSFSGVSKGILPREYFDVLDKLGDSGILDAIEWNEKINAFKPSKQEGHIRKLSRY